VRVSEVDTFIKDSKKAFSLFKQSFKPNNLSGGIYKFYVGERYACTATHVANRLYVVLHALSEDSTTKYRAVNHVHSLVVKAEDLVVVNKEIGYFPVNGIASPFKTKDFKVLEDAGIVSIYGYGNGQTSEPEVVMGFASPLGWCNAKTRDGDCSSPALDAEGKIVGFWTHGNGQTFGRFEPITKEFIEKAKDTNGPIHGGLDFRSSLLNLASL